MYKKKLTFYLTLKNEGGIGPPGIPSFGGIWLIGEGAGPEVWKELQNLIHN